MAICCIILECLCSRFHRYNDRRCLCFAFSERLNLFLDHAAENVSGLEKSQQKPPYWIGVLDRRIWTLNCWPIDTELKLNQNDWQFISTQHEDYIFICVFIYYDS